MSKRIEVIIPTGFLGLGRRAKYYRGGFRMSTDGVLQILKDPYDNPSADNIIACFARGEWRTAEVLGK